MKIKDALGLGSAEHTSALPLRIWLPVTVCLVIVATGILLAFGMASEWAVPVGLAFGIFASVPTSALVLRRGRRRSL